MCFELFEIPFESGVSVVLFSSGVLCFFEIVGSIFAQLGRNEKSLKKKCLWCGFVIDVLFSFVSLDRNQIDRQN